MTNNQLKVILATAKLGSISAAAKELGLSQPNASSCIKSAETELGFSIFTRTNTGIEISAKGMCLIEQAKKIIDANEAILSINNNYNPLQLKVGATSFLAACEAFVRFCNNHNTENNIKLNYTTMSTEEGIKRLANNALDVLVAVSFNDDDVLMERMCELNQLKRIFIKEIPTVLSARKGHPIFKEIKKVNIIEDADVLRKYPYVYYSQLVNENESGHTFKTFNIPCSGMITVQDIDARFRIVKSSDAFMMGMKVNNDISQKYGLASMPIDSRPFKIFYYIRNGESEREEITEYLSLLKEELNTINV